MNKFNYLILIFPMMFYLLMIFLMTLSSKINKFNPINLLFMLMIITFLICLKINFLYKSMMSFILFLIMIGGLMVIFMYITSLANNNLFSLNFKLLLKNLIKMLPYLMILMFLILTQTPLFTYFDSFLNLFNNNNNNKFINMIYNESKNYSTYFLMIYLYFSMICIMNICYKMKIPLRQILFYE